MKKLLSLTLILAILVATVVVGSVSASAQAYDTIVKVGSVNYVAQVGDTFSYTVSVKSSKPLSAGQLELPVDFDVLSADSEVTLNANIATVMPVVSDAGLVQRFDTPSKTGLKGYVLNFATDGSYDFTAYKVAFTLNFTVLKAGSITLDTALREFVDADGNDLIDLSGATVSGSVTTSTAVTLDKKSSFSVATPRISTLTNTADGIRLDWSAVSGAGKYRVFRFEDGKYSAIGTVDAVTFVDKSVVSGTAYTYTVRAMDASAKTYVSDYYMAGWTQTYVAEPVITDFESLENGLKFSWQPVAGAAKYRVFKRVDNAWKKLVITESAEYTDTDVTVGTQYTYTVRCMNESGAFVSTYNDAGFSGYFLGTPTLKSLSNGKGYVTVTWNAMTGAEKYRLFRKASNEDTNWVQIADTTATTYNDPIVESGITYSYTVRCISADGTKYTSPYVIADGSILYIAAPAVSKVANAVGGVTVTWSKVAGADKYRVFRKTTGGWSKLADTTAVTYTDKTAKSGTAYSYTVRCISADGKSFVSGYDTTGKKITYIAAPAVSKVANAVGGVTVTWGKIAGAAKYRVFRKLGSGSWSKLADTTALTYTDKKAVSGKTYSYTVRCITANGKSFTSACNTTGKSITYLAAPTLKSVAKGKGYVKFTWAKVSGAAKYTVYRKVGSGKWTALGTVKTLTYTDKKVAKNKKYTYTVRAVSSNGKVLSAYNTTGKAITYK